MASTSFRDRMNDLGWSRREQPANTQQRSPLLGTLSKFNPFNNGSYVQLPTTEGEGPGAPLPARTRREEEEGWFARKSETLSAYKILCMHVQLRLITRSCVGVLCLEPKKPRNPAVDRSCCRAPLFPPAMQNTYACMYCTSSHGNPIGVPSFKHRPLQCLRHAFPCCRPVKMACFRLHAKKDADLCLQ
jgi:hypothetical protein